MGTVAPQPSRLNLRVHAPTHRMSAEATGRLVLCHFADPNPEATLTFDRHDGVLTAAASAFRGLQRLRGVVEERKPGAAGHRLRR